MRNKATQARIIRCFEYGCREPVTGLKETIQQIFLRNRLWNNLVEIERAFNAQRRILLDVPAQRDLDEAFAELKEARSKLSAAKKKMPRQKHDEVIEDLASKIRDAERKLFQRAAIAGVIGDGTLTHAEHLKSAIKDLKSKAKEQRAAKRLECQAQLDEIETARRAKIKATRESSGLYWVNHDEVIANYETARIAAMKIGTDLKFHRFDGSGKITVRVDKGGANVLGMPEVDPQAYSSPVRSERRRLCRATVRLRTSNEEKELVPVEALVHLHRQAPQIEKIRTASLVRERIGSRFVYKLVMSAEVDAPAPRTGETVIIHLRHVRPVASWFGSDGRAGLIQLPERLIGNFKTCDDLRSLIKTKFNAARDLLAAWMKGNGRVPEWLKQEGQTLPHWLSPGRLLWLVNRWDRFKGDEMVFAAMAAWKTKHVHLWEWQRNLEDQMVRARREEYRKAAAELSSRYAVLRISGEDLARRKQRPEVEENRPAVAGRTRDIAAPGVLRGALINAFLREGGKIEDCPTFEAENQSANFANVRMAAGD